LKRNKPEKVKERSIEKPKYYKETREGKSTTVPAKGGRRQVSSRLDAPKSNCTAVEFHYQSLARTYVPHSQVVKALQTHQRGE
jgi:hypothetical protein